MPEEVISQETYVKMATAQVAVETAALTAVKESLEAEVASLKEVAKTQKAELESKIDILESEKAKFEKDAADAQKAFENYKTELAEKAELDVLKAERVKAAKTAGTHLEEAYFTEERTARWAELSEENFADIVEALESAAKKDPKKDAPVDDKDADDTQKMQEKARETSAFSGGESGGKKSYTRKDLFAAAGFVPASK